MSTSILRQLPSICSSINVSTAASLRSAGSPAKLRGNKLRSLSPGPVSGEIFSRGQSPESPVTERLGIVDTHFREPVLEREIFTFIFPGDELGPVAFTSFEGLLPNTATLTAVDCVVHAVGTEVNPA